MAKQVWRERPDLSMAWAAGGPTAAMDQAPPIMRAEARLVRWGRRRWAMVMVRGMTAE